MHDARISMPVLTSAHKLPLRRHSLSFDPHSFSPLEPHEQAYARTHTSYLNSDSIKYLRGFKGHLEKKESRFQFLLRIVRLGGEKLSPAALMSVGEVPGTVSPDDDLLLHPAMAAQLVSGTPPINASDM